VPPNPVPLNPTAVPVPVPVPVPAVVGVPKLFICYARDNPDSKIVIDELVKLLKPIVAQKQVVVFIDRSMPSGEEWKTRIRSEIESSQMALLLYCKDFFKSDFIRETELPRILSGYRQGRLKISAAKIGNHPGFKEIRYNFPDHETGPDSITISDLNLIAPKAYCDLSEKARETEIIHALVREILANCRAPA
jgi:hypothetical protein